jgi:RNA polymerase-binding transcription factor DksA
MSETDVENEPTPSVGTPIDADPAADSEHEHEAPVTIDGSADGDTASEIADVAAPEPERADAAATSRAAGSTSNDDGEPDLDLDAIARELADVEQALRRLDDGTYWTDELTGAPIPDAVLAADPTARRAAP